MTRRYTKRGEQLAHFRKAIATECDACMIWPYGLVRGYGIAWVDGRSVYVHRLAYESAGADATDKVVCHSCDTPACFNPRHLFAGTQADNLRDMVSKGRHRHPGLRGESHPRAKLTDEQVHAIRDDARRQMDIAADYGINQATVSAIKLGKTRKVAA